MEKNNSELISEIKNHKLSLTILYPFIPIIYFESGHKCYVDNPLFKKFKIKKNPCFVDFQIDRYEAWSDENVEIITDKGVINEIIKESLAVIEKFENSVKEFSSHDYLNLGNNEIIPILISIDKILREVYQPYIFYIDECFDTDDERLLKKLPEIRMKLSDFVSEIHVVLDKILKSLKNKFSGIDSQFFDYATFGEMIDFLKNPEDKSKVNSIIKRPIAFAGAGNEMEILAGDEVLELKEYLEEKADGTRIGNVEEIKGKVAFKGSGKGKVKIILESDYDNFGKVMQADESFVLVTPMTRPEIVPYLKNCIAIITDEGGITCHAAIVSRELKKPCIIGTKIATQVLKDGDLVEVDANEGVVKILKSN